jgi:hypothetical protein
MKLTQKQIDQAWSDRGSENSTVVWSKEGKGIDSDFMTIAVDGQSAQTYERSLGSTDWVEVTNAPVPAQQTKITRFQPSGDDDRNKDRTFEIHVSSEASGYRAKVFELLYGGSRVIVCLPGLSQCHIAPTRFFKMREHYRGEFLASVKAELRSGTVVRFDSAERSTPDCYLGADMSGWPNGYPDATSDNMETWINE